MKKRGIYMTITLNEKQWKIFKALLDSDKEMSAQEISDLTAIDLPMVSATFQYGEEQGWIKINIQERDELILADDIEEIIEKGLPERQALLILKEIKKISVKELSQLAKEKNLPVNEIIKWGTFRGWIKKDKEIITITDKGIKAIEERDDDEKAIEILKNLKAIFIDELKNYSLEPEIVKRNLRNRSAIAKIKTRSIRYGKLTEQGKRTLSADIKVLKEKSILTSEDIVSGEWRNIALRHYDVTLPAERIYPAKIHLMQKIVQQTRKAFLEMGFTEIVSPQVESAFWDFDALFQPQDHPARDMQDTFYLERPAKAKLPEGEIIQIIKATHENGWKTGSKGWGYSWDIEKAKQVVLRTHTTASTIRALANNPNPPRKVFCIGKVYRNEAISYKHLPEFFQVDGIIIDEQANLATLLGTLKEFYCKMGFEKIRFKPSFFPYTEPSVEISVYLETKKAWLEMGGSGVFRPEVTLPFGCKVPVLAWGLGLDRLAMLRYNIHDIREIYWSDLDKIKEIPLCQ